MAEFAIHSFKDIFLDALNHHDGSELMNRDEKSGKEYSKHISMELTADSARVTNLSLDGSRLVLTIEAELAGSQLRSSDAAAQRTAPQPETIAEPACDDTQSAKSSQSASASSHGGFVQPDENAKSISQRRFSSENLSPPAAAFMPGQMGDSSLGTLSTTAPQDLSQSLMINPDTILDTPDSEQPAVGPALFAKATSQETVGIFPTPPELPDQDILTGTPVVPPPLPVEETEKHEKTPIPWQAPELTSEDSAKDVITHAPVSERITPPPMPVSESAIMKPAHLESPLDDEMALSEESSVIGGARHGEPQPSLAFGQDASNFSELTAALSNATLPTPVVEKPDTTEKPSHPEKAENKDESAAAATLPSQSEQPQKTVETPESDKEKPQDQPDKPQSESSNAESAKSKPDENKQADKPTGGSTTVLIRYTCPKCKTQGMQAVDKVGTVVNCSNCGKAMRLVMKK